MKEALLKYISHLEASNNFQDDFYLTCIGQLNEGDISDWYNNNYNDSVELGFSAGQTDMAADVIMQLKKIIEEN